MGRAEQITRVIRGHDPKLYCLKDRSGKLVIYRQYHRIEWYDLDEGKLGFVRPAPFFIMALTTDWQLKSPSVDWGLLPILDRLKTIDLHERDLAGEYIENYEKDSLSNLRQFQNNNEAFLKDYRRKFAKAFNDVITTNLAKTDRRKLKEKSIWQ